VRSVLLTRGAEFIELKTFFKLLLVLVRVIVHPFTHGTLETNEIVLGHKIFEFNRILLIS